MFQLAITICLKPDEKIEISEINKSYKKKQKETMELKKKKKNSSRNFETLPDGLKRRVEIIEISIILLEH